MGITETLRGALVRRAQLLGSRAFALELSTSATRGALVCSAEPGAQGLGLVASIASLAPGLEPASGSQTFRALVEGARLERFTRVGTSAVWIELTRAEQSIALVLDGLGGGAMAVVRDGTEIIFQLGRPKLDIEAKREPFEPAETLDELKNDGERLAALLASASLRAHKAALLKSLRAQVKRRERRLAAIEGDAARVVEADTLRVQAGLLLANLSAFKDSRGEITLIDYAVEPALERTLHIDPKLGARKQIDAWFERARRLQRGAVLAEQRAVATRAEQSALLALCDELESATGTDQLEPILQSARAFGVGGHLDQVSKAPEKRGAKAGVRVPYREFRGAGERPIFVGRGAGDNDALTLRHARPHDLFLHVRDASGAHVIVPLERTESCPPELLCDAATLAAHFSSARGEPRVDVIYTPRRYIQKPRKAPAGSVLLLREKVFRLILEPIRLRRLLDHEWAPGFPSRSV